MSTLRRHGITDFEHSARMVTKEDFQRFHYILAMDKYNLRDLQSVRDTVIASMKNPSAAARSAGMKTTRAAAAAGDPDGKVAEVRLFGDFLETGEIHKKIGGGEEVQDPYYGGQNGFEEVHGQVVRFSKGLVVYLEKKAAGQES
jgi:low molecular weight phosphotyrosine protein phosphatase